MGLEKEETIFGREFLYELYARGIRSFPFDTLEYRRALKQIKSSFESENQLNYPLDALLVEEVFIGGFPRMYAAIMSHLGQDVGIEAPYFNRIILNLYYRKIEDPLVKKFAESFIKELKLD